jgi:hypothetical protein
MYRLFDQEGEGMNPLRRISKTCLSRMFAAWTTLRLKRKIQLGKKNAGTSIEIARELLSVPAECEPAGAQYGAVYSARRGYSGEL